MKNSTNTNPQPITTELPQGLRLLRCVKCWAGQQYTDTGDKLNKTPKGRSGQTIGPNRPQDLGTYDEIAEMCRQRNFNGMAIHTGLKIRNDVEMVIQALDLDGVRDPLTGTITDQAADIVRDFNSYTEISATGTGLHIVYLSAPDSSMKQIAKEERDPLGTGTRLEMFTAGHFCGITGNIYAGYDTLGLRDHESKTLYLQYFDYAEIDQDIAETEKKRISSADGNRTQIDRLKRNIEDYLQRNGLPLHKPFRCVNPAHDDKHPSMSYYRKGKLCHCFSCGANYDIFGMAGALENLPTFPEQLKYIAEYYGEPVEPYRPDQDPAPVKEVEPPMNIYEYLTGGQYAADLEQFQKGAEVKTGFPALDQMIGGGLYAGLYVLGAVPTLGKTTYALQLADQIAEQHKHVLFFSMEQSRLELVTKSISRTARELYPGDQRGLKTSLQIRKGYTSDEMEQAKQIYINAIASYISIAEGNFTTTADTIRATVDKFIEENNDTPVVIIDYLQILQPLKGSRATDPRTLTDQNITALKRLSRDLSVPVVAISSFNRMNYRQTVDYESFKETSGIEYTADVLLGMEYKVISTLEGKNPNTDREIVNHAKEMPEREITMKCLKNRYGQSHFEIPMKYYPRFDYFIECQDNRRRLFDGVPMK